jgi:hypothetical protein
MKCILSQLISLIEEKLEAIPNELSEVEEIYNLECAQNFLEILISGEDEMMPQEKAKDELLFHLGEANADSEWMELARSIDVSPMYRQLALIGNE